MRSLWRYLRSFQLVVRVLICIFVCNLLEWLKKITWNTRVRFYFIIIFLMWRDKFLLRFRKRPRSSASESPSRRLIPKHILLLREKYLHKRNPRNLRNEMLLLRICLLGVYLSWSAPASLHCLKVNEGPRMMLISSLLVLWFLASPLVLYSIRCL